ncbi:BON domain-containing protein [Stenotrophomonas sp. C3(2023)]|uniref:BON domain-containing protein n=1 Tax=Stenotrophomonas sp. C3(2023) TaxID=3080277 RepID=UPI00293C1C50|nr:BON domain-containing protein [Stenotrophomonas sp. C3(2023)]MDV3467523.1 BON domain-containing protein [Stenotrophomonas sp. C3(2023)]
MKHINQLTMAAGLGLLLAAPLALANDPPRTDRQHDGHAMTHADRHDSNEPVTDTWITTKVKADLLTSSNVPGTEVKVETVNGVVSLSGTVANQAEHDKAVTTARGIKGVQRVDASALRVAPMASR